MSAAAAAAPSIQDAAEAVQIAEHSADDFSLIAALLCHGITLVSRGDPERGPGLEALARAREAAQQRHYYTVNMVATVDIYDAKEKIRLGDLDGAIELARATIDNWFRSVGSRSIVLSSVGHQATTALVEVLLARGTETDRAEAKAAIDRLAAVPTEPGFVLHELPLLRLRALLAGAHGDDTAYRDYRDRYRDMARTLGFEGHMKWAEAMR